MDFSREKFLASFSASFFFEFNDSFLVMQKI